MCGPGISLDDSQYLAARAITAAAASAPVAASERIRIRIRRRVTLRLEPGSEGEQVIQGIRRVAIHRRPPIASYAWLSASIAS
jgi:hypothetical protein